MTRSSQFCRLGVLVALATCGWLQAAHVSAEEISVWTIKASEKKETSVPKELSPIADALKSSFKFKSYALLNRVKGKVEANAKRFELAGDYFAMIKHVETKGGKITLDIKVMVKKGKETKTKLATKVSVAPGKHQLMGGWKISGDDRMIIALSPTK